MAADTSSSLTSTSHTLTADTNMAANTAAEVGVTSALLQSLRPENRHTFLKPTRNLPTESLNVVRDTLEAFASQVGEEQQRRQRETRKRKRGGEKEDILKLRKIHVAGFETNQVWQQAKKVIDGVLRFSNTLLNEMEANNEIILGENVALDDFASDGCEKEASNSEEETDCDEYDVRGFVSEDLGVYEEGGPEDKTEPESTLLGDVMTGPSDEEQEDVDQEDDEDNEDHCGLVEDIGGLNDGFFSLDDFNKQTQWFEEQDIRGDPNTDMGSEDDEIDWTADPNASSENLESKGKLSRRNTGIEDGEREDSVEDDDGPIFGNMALDAPEGDSDVEAAAFEDGLDDTGANNANDIFYKDFFAPPRRKKDFNKAKKSIPKIAETKEEALERAMADVRRDLFDDESDMEGSDDVLSDASAGDPKSRRSAHERRQAKLAEEIRKLEAASVAKREWTLSGEASAAERPTNSLLEQDLDFEYVGKPVPIITPEVSESIDQLIKRRILSQEFDEVLRRRPDTDTISSTRRGLVDVKDSKSDKSLAQIYEEEHIKNTDPDNYVSQSDEKLQREEKEVESMWKEVSAKLDALSSWHYKPKPTAASLSVVADVATISMEDAQPATAQGVAGESSRMAPQEVYKAGADNIAKGEVVTRSGLPVARQEMSREDKLRRRRQHKERVRKAGSNGPGNTRASTASSKRAQTIADLKKGGVKVINRKGEITDVEGKKAKAAKPITSLAFKL